MRVSVIATVLNEGPTMERLLASPEERERLGRLGRQRVLERFTNRTIAARTHALWQRVLGGEGDG